MSAPQEMVSERVRPEDVDALSRRVNAVLRQCTSRLAQSRDGVRGLSSERDQLAVNLREAEDNFGRMGENWRELKDELEAVRGALISGGAVSKGIRDELACVIRNANRNGAGLLTLGDGAEAYGLSLLGVSPGGLGFGLGGKTESTGLVSPRSAGSSCPTSAEQPSSPWPHHRHGGHSGGGHRHDHRHQRSPSPGGEAMVPVHAIQSGSRSVSSSCPPGRTSASRRRSPSAAAVPGVGGQEVIANILAAAAEPSPVGGTAAVLAATEAAAIQLSPGDHHHRLNEVESNCAALEAEMLRTRESQRLRGGAPVRRHRRPPTRRGGVGSVTNDLFDMVDRNHDGKISRTEFRSAIKGGIISGQERPQSMKPLEAAAGEHLPPPPGEGLPIVGGEVLADDLPAVLARAEAERHSFRRPHFTPPARSLGVSAVGVAGAQSPAATARPAK